MLMSSSQTVELHVKYSTTTEHNPPEANYCCGRGDGPNNGYRRCIKHYLKAKIAQVLLDHGHNRRLVFVTKDKPMLIPPGGKTMAVLAVMRGKPMMVTTTAA
jgi:hypothetical protein